VLAHGDFATQPPNGKTFISGHFGFSYAEPLLKDRFSFTFLRDPIERLISLYNFSRNRDPQESSFYAFATENEFSNFVSLFADGGPHETEHYNLGDYESVWNHMTWQLAYGWNSQNTQTPHKTILDYSEEELLRLAKANLKRLGFVGLHQSYERDAVYVRKRLGMPEELPIPQSNKSPKTVRMQDLDLDTLGKVKTLNRLDMELYDYARQLRRGFD